MFRWVVPCSWLRWRISYTQSTRASACVLKSWPYQSPSWKADRRKEGVARIALLVILEMGTYSQINVLKYTSRLVQNSGSVARGGVRAFFHSYLWHPSLMHHARDGWLDLRKLSCGQPSHRIQSRWESVSLNVWVSRSETEPSAVTLRGDKGTVQCAWPTKTCSLMLVLRTTVTNSDLV